MSSERQGEPATGRVVAYTVALGAVCVAVSPVLAREPALRVLPPYGFAVIVGLFLAGELLLIHVPTRRDTHTVSFIDIPLTLGLFFLPPLQLAAAAVLGAGAALRFHRGQRGVKFAFNLVEVCTQAFVATIVFRALRGAGPLVGPRSFLAAAAAAISADLFSALLVTFAIALYRSAWPGLGAFELLAGCLATIAKTALALLAVGAVVDDGAVGLVPVAVCAATMYGAFRSYASLHERHRRLTLVHGFTSAVGASVQLDAIARAVVGEARDVLRATRTRLRLETYGGALTWSVTVDGAMTVDRDAVEHDELSVELDRAGGAIVGDDRLARAVALRSGLRGYLLAEDPLGGEASFDEVDVRLFDAIVDQAAIALDNGALVEKVEVEARDRERRATHDPLTDLPNRAHFRDALDERLATSAARFVLFVVGLDRFSEVNETVGHENGDAVLRETAARLRGVGPNCTVARLGGDEFAVLFELDDVHRDMRAVADRLAAALQPRITIDGLSLEVGASMGAAVVPDHAPDADGLLRCADTAMRTAKRRRSRFEMYVGGTSETRRRLSLAHDLGRAIERRELSVFYQPKVDVESGVVYAVEALARWRHSERGLVPADDFIAVAEHVGLIEPLTSFVLDEALVQRARWSAAGVHLSVAVNVSARSLVDDTIVNRVSRALVRHRCPPELLTLEITETQLMGEPERAATVLAELHGLGVRISIDDFGTGFSSLSSLRALPIDEVKIDKSFMVGARNNGSDAEIVRSIVALARGLGMHVVVEGVEDEEAFEFVRACGGHAAQGFHFTAPLEPGALVAWLRRRERADAEPVPEPYATGARPAIT